MIRSGNYYWNALVLSGAIVSFFSESRKNIESQQGGPCGTPSSLLGMCRVALNLITFSQAEGLATISRKVNIKLMSKS